MSIDALIHHVAETEPARIAVAGHNERLTFAELDAQASRIAWWLTEWQVPLGAEVGLCCRRTLDFVVGALGVVRAGCTYVPLDPDIDGDRRRRQGWRLPLVLVGDRCQRAAAGCGRERHQLPTLRRHPIGDDSTRPRRVLTPDRPLCLQLGDSPLDDHPTHADLLIGPAMSLRRQPREIHLLTRSPADPDHVFQLWPPLAAGHTLALPPDVLLAEDRDLLSAWLREHASGRPRRPPRPVMASR